MVRSPSAENRASREDTSGTQSVHRGQHQAQGPAGPEGTAKKSNKINSIYQHSQLTIGFTMSLPAVAQSSTSVYEYSRIVGIQYVTPSHVYITSSTSLIGSPHPAIEPRVVKHKSRRGKTVWGFLSLHWQCHEWPDEFS